MLSVAIVLALACAVLAQPPRPAISEDFYAEVQTELHEQDQVIFGEGRWAVDTTSNEGVEEYKFQDDRHHEEVYVLNLQRYDIGKVYSLNSADRSHCAVDSVSGNMPSTWGWIAQASYGGQFNYHGQELNIWNATFGGVRLNVGVATNNPNVPVIFNRDQTSSALYISFYRFNASTNFNHSIFDVPPYCNASESLFATPARPNPSEVFEAEVEVQFQRSHDQIIAGEGRLASNQPAGQFVEDYDLQSPRDHRFIKFFSLLRYDLGKQYSINSHNYTDCLVQQLTGSMPTFWGWISSASFIEQRTSHDFTEDIWSLIVGGVNLTISVADSDVNTPLWLSRTATGTNEFWDFRYFNGTTPNPADFQVPQECSQN